MPPREADPHPLPPNITLTTTPGPSITDYTLQSVLTLYNSHYGRYGPHAADANPFLVPGTHIQLSLCRLRHLNVSDVTAVTLAEAYRTVGTREGDEEKKLVGCAFGTRWCYENEGKKETVLWITLLVVHRHFRSLGIATHLIRALHSPHDTFTGLASWSPFGTAALYRAITYRPISHVDLNATKTHAKGILKGCELDYLRDAPLQGSLFEEDEEERRKVGRERVVSCIQTKNYVDLEDVKDGVAKAERKGWPLGELPEGGEFLLIVETPRGQEEEEK
ncbi:hypothetical protein BJ508DRAFT_412438 [Ascobolus immersus RN42]|uniref:N-acetyltransferase domain-containing protein n=1 Tax=Ascobolus immersus RN42 TaxID=1160509 RepID=A0A3N4IGD5_ASCIM|nr:hypothetical protein BJ508DRAFT_412438 [Ascobolus immersus RN42]